jgi:hypothetical protein
MSVLRRQVDDYRNGRIGLNTLIQSIEGIGAVLDSGAWKDAIFPIVLSMEQISAVALDEKRGLTEADKVSVENSLITLEALIDCFGSE